MPVIFIAEYVTTIDFSGFPKYTIITLNIGTPNHVPIFILLLDRKFPSRMAPNMNGSKYLNQSCEVLLEKRETEKEGY